MGPGSFSLVVDVEVPDSMSDRLDIAREIYLAFAAGDREVGDPVR
jgi:hypothetical protein